ncbi:trafficking protein particle complex subunit 12-like [Saccostrea cucullata]|uniref:trafficking protein particle complex subunit 12-like n=1 Tax=Saccostrea cuccullata TaxID=36930 RepID=UPI002ED1A017
MSDDKIIDVLDDDFLDDSQFDDSFLSPDVTNRIVHSATSDTLDSVALGPITDELSLLEDPSDSNPSIAEDTGIEIAAPGVKEITEYQTTDVPINLETSIETLEVKPLDSPVKDQVNISSYFTSDSQENDPFSALSSGQSQEEVNLSLSQAEETEQPQKVEVEQQNLLNQTNDQQPETEDSGEIVVRHDTLERRLSKDEPESVDFEAVPENDLNVMEASMQLIDDKEDFESFTAESGPADIDQAIGGITDIHLNERHRTTSETMHHDYNTQLSVSSQHSQGAIPTPPIIPSPVNQPFSGPPLSAVNVAPLLTPTTPVFSTQSHVSDGKETAVQGTLDLESSATNTFQSLPNVDTTDPFTASLQMSESDRQHDAWIPSDGTRQTLLTIATSVPGSYVPTLEELSTPGIVVDEPQGDPVRDLVYRYMGEQEAIKRQILTVDSVTQDVEGLQALIKGGCYRSAVDMCRRLLTAAGQGPGKAGEITQHTVHTIQLWFCRFTLLLKLRLYSVAESEMQAFQNLDTPDLYFEFYPHIYPGRKGSMVPFGMRILHAEIPHYMGRSQETIDRLYYILAVTQKIIKNLQEGYAEDGSAVQLSDGSRKGSLEIWQERERQVLYVIGNTFLALRDYEAAMTIYNNLLEKDPTRKAGLLSGMGRIYLQMGNVDKAQDCFKHSEVISNSGDKSIQCRNAINRGLEAMCMNNFSDAYQNFKQAVEADPTNTSAVNNMAACSLYMGKLMDALKTLEVLVHEDPVRNLHEGVLFNLCTLYELESSRALHKKQALLDLVSRHKGDGFPAACLKMA